MAHRGYIGEIVAPSKRLFCDLDLGVTAMMMEMQNAL
jgi:hypothetical protein